MNKATTAAPDHIAAQHEGAGHCCKFILLWCRKVLNLGDSTAITADAKFGGPLHIEALPEQQQVLQVAAKSST